VDKWTSIAAIAMVTTVAACTASQQADNKIQPILSINGKTIADNGAIEYEKGKQLLNQGRFAVAAQAFEAALFAGGSSVKVLNALAVSYDKLGRYDLSDRYYERALALDSSDPQTANNLAVSLARRGAPDLAIKVLADAQVKRPNDQTITANLKLAQEQVAKKPEPVASAPLPVPAIPQVPRIEQASPSAQKLVTVGAARTDSMALQSSVTPVAISRVADATDATAPAQTNITQAGVASAPSGRPKIIAEVLAPLPKVASAMSAKAPELAASSLHTSDVPSANARQMTDKPADVVTKKPDFEKVPALNESALTVLAYSRLGSRIVESDNIQPVGLAAHGSTVMELALARLGIRLEVANGAGRRYMAARMRTFLDNHGFNVARVTNAQSFDHVQTIIVYRDQFQPQALELAKALTTKVKLQHAAGLSADIQLILGRDLLPFDRTLEKGG